ETDDAQARVAAKNGEIYKGKAVKRANCGQGGSLHKRKKCADGTVRDRLARFYCGRSDCPFCWRGRLSRTLNRAARRLLYTADQEPRCEKVWFVTIPTSQRKSLNRKLRRLHGEDCGRLFLDRTDEFTLVFCDKPLHGGSAL